MKKIALIFTILFVPFFAFAEGDVSTVERISNGVNEFIEPIVSVVNDVVFYKVKIVGIEVPFVLIWLIFAAVLFTIRFRFINFRGFKYAINLVRGKYDLPGETMDWDGDEEKVSEGKKAEGQVSHFQALTTALSGTVGLGNISGVAIAIAAGGPGATFWMIMAGLLGMSSKFVECTLGVKFRKVNEDGSVSGGPMYYLSRGFKAKNPKLAGLGKVLAVFFAIMCVGGSFGGGNMYQAHEARAQFAGMSVFEGTFIQEDGGAVVFGVIMAVAVGFVIIGGIRSIAKVTDKIVPFMCGIYVLCALIVLGVNFSAIPKAFSEIFSGAFSWEAGLGGFLGVLIQGFKRAAFSNEAGIGSAAIAHSAVQTDEPVTEGLVALLEPFIDTVIVCTMTALVIIITGAYLGDEAGVQMTSSAFADVFGSGANLILTVAVILFAFSTMISWSYYGLKAWTYLFGEGKSKEITYKAIFCLFIVIGSILSLDQVVSFSDAMIFAMCFPNIIGLYILGPMVETDLNLFVEKIKRHKIQSKS